MAVPTAAQLLSFIVELEDDPKRRNAANSGWDLFTAARDAWLVGHGDLDTFAGVVQDLVEQELLTFRVESAGVIPPVGGRWDGNWLQQHAGFETTAAGRQDAEVYRRREEQRRVTGQGLTRPPRPAAESDPPLAYWFERLDSAFALPAPANFPFFPRSLGEETARVLRRYASTGRELSESTVLNSHGHGFQVSFDPSGVRSVDVDLPSGEAQRGMAVLFRQLYANDEPASFNAVMRALLRATNEGSDSHSELRRAILVRWGRAHRELRRRWLDELLFDQAQQRGDLPAELKRPEEKSSPEQVLSAFFYGEHIHWARGVEQLKRWGEDPLADARHRLLFLTAMCQLSAVYIGFGALVVTAVPFDNVWPGG